MKIVGLVSSYREGRLVHGAIWSLVHAVDQMLVFEGPAGAIPEGIEAAPESLLPDVANGPILRRGRWRTDARKRNEMLQEAKRLYPGEPVWGVWLDGDELLANGEWLRDRLQAVVWNDEYDGSGTPTIHQPLWTCEGDGSMALTTGRVVRLDLIRSYDISVSVVTAENGVEQAFGNRHPDAGLWIDLWMKAAENRKMIAWPPGPLEPCIVHRSHLRHPLRRGLRLHKQEADELRKAGKL